MNRKERGKTAKRLENGNRRETQKEEKKIKEWKNGQKRRREGEGNKGKEKGMVNSDRELVSEKRTCLCMWFMCYIWRSPHLHLLPIHHSKHLYLTISSSPLPHSKGSRAWIFSLRAWRRAEPTTSRSGAPHTGSSKFIVTWRSQEADGRYVGLPGWIFWLCNLCVPNLCHTGHSPVCTPLLN